MSLSLNGLKLLCMMFLSTETVMHIAIQASRFDSILILRIPIDESQMKSFQIITLL